MRPSMGSAFRRGLLFSVAAIATASPAIAQSTAAQPASDDSGTIVVTATRIDKPGFEAPTPTRVVSAQDLQIGAPTSIGAAIDNIPGFRASTSPGTTFTNDNPGYYTADLRGLGDGRTLTLIDGHRSLMAYDLNTVPFQLVRRVDVVTGGASADWGSGAVAGVVNVLLDDKRTGGLIDGSFGRSTYGDGNQYRIAGSYGLKFGEGRGHLMAAAEYVDNKGITPQADRSWDNLYAVLANPAGSAHAFTLTQGVVSSTMNYAGVINSGVLKGQTFNPDGSLRPFVYGSVISGSRMVGGEGYTNARIQPLIQPLKRFSALASGSYELTDSVNLFANVHASKVWTRYAFWPEQYGAITIPSSNAFLAQGIKNQLAAAGQTSFSLGKAYSDIGNVTIDNSRRIYDGTIGLNGKFGATWKWDAYYSHGELKTHIGLDHLLLAQNFANAVDSVLSPTTGQPICRVTLTNAQSGCVPINLFGVGAPSAAAVNYISGLMTTDMRQTLDVGGATLRGDPIDLPAGPLSIAVGVEARHEFKSASPNALALQNAFMLFNYAPQRGGFSVEEGFVEVLAPILRDVPAFKALDFNGAVRISHYNTTGSVWSWKYGLTDQVTPDIRIRANMSRDIRSPNLDELFSQNSVNIITVNDPVTGGQPLVTAVTGGTTAVKPETSDTLTIGGVLTPSVAPGLSLAVDYYHIKIKNVITTLSPQDLVTRCFNGNAALCDRIIRVGGVITRIQSTYVNLANLTTSGVDLDVSYSLPLQRLHPGWGGRLQLRALVNYVGSLSQSDGISTIDYLGSLGSSSSRGVPQWSGSLSLTYAARDFDLTTRVRYIGGGDYNATQDISNNHINARAFVDLNVDYVLPIGASKPLTLYGAVSNLFNQHPPVLPNAAIYDIVGRYFTIGVKARF